MDEREDFLRGQRKWKGEAKMRKKLLDDRPTLRTCRECGDEAIMIAEKVEISIRGVGIAIEIVADDICLGCLKQAIDAGH